MCKCFPSTGTIAVAQLQSTGRTLVAHMLRFLPTLALKGSLWNLGNLTSSLPWFLWPKSIQPVSVLSTRQRPIFLRKPCKIINNNDKNNKMFPQSPVIAYVPWKTRVKRRKACRTKCHRAQTYATSPTLIYASLSQTWNIFTNISTISCLSLVQDVSLHLLSTQNISIEYLPCSGRRKRKRKYMVPSPRVVKSISVLLSALC